MDRVHPLLRRLLAALRPFARDRRGGTAIEYGLILALIVLAMMGALNSVASTTTGMWNNVSSKVLQHTPS